MKIGADSETRARKKILARIQIPADLIQSHNYTDLDPDKVIKDSDLASFCD